MRHENVPHKNMNQGIKHTTELTKEWEQENAFDLAEQPN